MTTRRMADVLLGAIVVAALAAAAGARQEHDPLPIVFRVSSCCEHSVTTEDVGVVEAELLARFNDGDMGPRGSMIVVERVN